MAPTLWLIAIASCCAAICSGQEVIADDGGVQVLTRGPVHEAFAGVISFESQPGIIITQAPPNAIEEIPPGEWPEGDFVTWIPGYWAWDDERGDFLWISGTWRALPPGQEWMVGYWGKIDQGYQWTSGYWADVRVAETTYLPEPPRTVEEGPNIAAPAADYGWTPGNWMWHQERYAWSPGYWAQGRADWVWVPAHYVWTRRGYVFVDGFWDHTVQRRGVLFAPVYFDRRVYSRPQYSYSPSIVINLSIFSAHLFVRPRYDHYYFGDYYDRSYINAGYYSSFSYQSSRRGYDPVYSHQRWEHRDDRDWERRVQNDYQNRRDNERSRPPRTWEAQRQMDGRGADFRQNDAMVATSFDEYRNREDGPRKFENVSKGDREVLARREMDVEKFREQRRQLEGRGADSQPAGREPGPSKIASAKSPIAAKPGREGQGKAAPPEPQRAPRLDMTDRGKPDAKGKPDSEGKPEPQSRPQPQSMPQSQSRPQSQPQAKPQPQARPQSPSRPPTPESPQSASPKRSSGKQPPQQSSDTNPKTSEGARQTAKEKK